jgi:hypothetical protein
MRGQGTSADKDPNDVDAQSPSTTGDPTPGGPELPAPSANAAELANELAAELSLTRGGHTRRRAVPAWHPAGGRPDMVKWYDPGQLARTGAQVAISGVLGQRLDFRLTEALLAPDQPPFDYRGAGVPFHFDYVADVGDGWAPTYAMARLLAQPELDVSGSEGHGAVRLPRGRLLVMGGDQVYPSASRADYAKRLVHPFTCALPTPGRPAADGTPPEPHLFAIPGNHDWYDGLVEFSQHVCRQYRIGGWHTRQSRSYFALRLPEPWWLLAIDIQLGSGLDPEQRRYFDWVVHEHIGPGGQVILCAPEPTWVRATKAGPEVNHTISELERQVSEQGALVRLCIAGDLHHYRRYSRDGDELAPTLHKVTAGGGGAFLHPTHRLPNELAVAAPVANGERGATFKHVQSFPSPQVSRGLSGGNRLGFLVRNPSFGLLPALAYTLLAWTMPRPMDHLAAGDSLHRLLRAMVLSADATFSRPAGVFAATALVACFVAFTSSRRRWFRAVGGLGHGLAHLSAALVLAGIADWCLVAHFGLSRPQILVSLPRLVFVFGTGWVVGSLVMGLYLWLALEVAGEHANEAFSALRCPDYKSFLRLTVTESRELVVHVIGVDRVPRTSEWTGSRKDSGDAYELRPGSELQPKVVDRFTIAPELPKPTHRGA